MKNGGSFHSYVSLPEGTGEWDIHRIGRWENLQETPIFDGNNHGFL